MNLSPGAAQFLRSHIDSPLSLDVLLALYAHPLRWWAAEELAVGLRGSPESIARALDGLAIASLLDVKVGNHLRYRFAPLQDGIASIIEEIATFELRKPSGTRRRFIEPV
jgi:hypothetical protein